MFAAIKDPRFTKDISDVRMRLALPRLKKKKEKLKERKKERKEFILLSFLFF